MTVTITVPDLASAVRVDLDPNDPTDPNVGILTRLLSVATRRVEDFAPSADVDTQNRAVVSMCGYLFDAPPVQRSPVNAFVNSGARSMLANDRDFTSATV